MSYQCSEVIVMTESTEMIASTIQQLSSIQEAYKQQQAAFIELQIQNITIMQEMYRKIEQLERTVATLEKVNASQVKAIQEAIKIKANAVILENRILGCEKEVAALIRKSVRNLTGVRGVKSIACIDYPTVMQTIETWDDYAAVKRIRDRIRKGASNG